MRRSVLVVSESLLLWLGGLIACFLRLGSDVWWELVERHGWLKLLLLVGVVQLSFYLFDLYDAKSLYRARATVIGLAKAYTLACIALSLLFYAIPRGANRKRIISHKPGVHAFNCAGFKVDIRMVYGAPAARDQGESPDPRVREPGHRDSTGHAGAARIRFLGGRICGRQT